MIATSEKCVYTQKYFASFMNNGHTVYWEESYDSSGKLNSYTVEWNSSDVDYTISSELRNSYFRGSKLSNVKFYFYFDSSTDSNGNISYRTLKCDIIAGVRSGSSGHTWATIKTGLQVKTIHYEYTYATAQEICDLTADSGAPAETEMPESETDNQETETDIAESTESLVIFEYVETEENSDEDSDYIIRDSDSRYLTEADVEGLSLQEINYAKNEIFARKGRKFNSSELQNYFNSKDWYTGLYEPADFDANYYSILMNEYDIANSEFLAQVEHAIDPNGYQPAA